MKRRSFFQCSLLAGLGLAAGRAHASDNSSQEAIVETGIDPYFLDAGDVTAEQQADIEAFIGYQQDVMEKRNAVMPRGGKPKRAPTYRLLHWEGDIGSPGGRWIGPLSLSPALDDPGPYSFNAQILGFNVSTMDWSGAKGHGTLSIEIRARHQGEALTWLFLEQFDVVKGGGTTVGLEYVAQRDGIPEAVSSELPNVDIRIQLVRQRKAPGVLRKILKVGSFITGLPVGGGSGVQPSFEASQPLIRVPRLAREGVAFAQATIGGMSEEAPVWRSGFTSFALASGGSRLALRPGLWVAVDDSKEIDYQALRLQDAGGSLSLMQDGRPVDVNYVVLGLEIKGSAAAREVLPSGVVPKG